MSSGGKRQLQQIVLRYCDWGGSSKGMREFLRAQVVDFCRANPDVAVETEVKRNRHPFIRGVYLNGREKTIDCPNRDVAWIAEKVRFLNEQVGDRASSRYSQPVYSSRPTIQGLWDQDVPYQRFDFEVEHKP